MNNAEDWQCISKETENWLCKFMHKSEMPTIRMRPIGDYTPEESEYDPNPLIL